MLFAYAQMPLINAYASVSSDDTSLNLSLSHCLHPYFVYANSEGSGESPLMRICTDSPEPSLLADEKYRYLVH